MVMSRGYNGSVSDRQLRINEIKINKYLKFYCAYIEKNQNNTTKSVKLAPREERK